jgi:acyl-CoA thioester hydrolase
MHTIKFRIYYEDTDAGGVVYYANYLKFAERARTELLRYLGLEQSELIEKDGILFIATTIEKLSGASVTMYQKISCNGNELVNVRVVVVCVNSSIKPVRVPDYIRKKMMQIG